MTTLCNKHNHFPNLSDEIEARKVKQLIKDIQGSKKCHTEVGGWVGGWTTGSLTMKPIPLGTTVPSYQLRGSMDTG